MPPKPPNTDVQKYIPPASGGGNAPPLDPNKDTGWPPTWQLLRDTVKLCTHLSFHFHGDLDREPYEISCSSRDSYMSFRGATPTHALRKLVLMLAARQAMKQMPGGR